MTEQPVISRIREEIVRSVKDRNPVKAETLRFLLSAVNNEAIAKYGAAGSEKLTDDDCLGVIRRQVKSHKESVTAFRSAGREDLAGKEEMQLSILASYLPQELSDPELAAVVDKVISRNPGMALGPLTGKAIAETAGRADGSRVATLLRSRFTG